MNLLGFLLLVIILTIALGQFDEDDTVAPYLPDDDEGMLGHQSPFPDEELLPIHPFDSYNPDPSTRFISYDNVTDEIYVANPHKYLQEGDDRFYKWRGCKEKVFHEAFRYNTVKNVHYFFETLGEGNFESRTIGENGTEPLMPTFHWRKCVNALGYAQMDENTGDILYFWPEEQIYFNSNNTIKSNNDPNFDKFKLREKYHVPKTIHRTHNMTGAEAEGELIET